MEQLSLYVPGIMGLAFALVAFLSVRHIAGHRPQVEASREEAKESPRPFEFAPPGGVLKSLHTMMGGGRIRSRKAGNVTTRISNESTASYPPQSLLVREKT